MSCWLSLKPLTAKLGNNDTSLFAAKRLAFGQNRRSLAVLKPDAGKWASNLGLLGQHLSGNDA